MTFPSGVKAASSPLPTDIAAGHRRKVCIRRAALADCSGTDLAGYAKAAPDRLAAVHSYSGLPRRLCC